MEWFFGTTIIYYSFNGEDFFPQGSSKYSVVKEGSVYTLTVNDLRMNDGALPYICKPEALKPEQASLTILGKCLEQIILLSSYLFPTLEDIFLKTPK